MSLFSFFQACLAFWYCLDFCGLGFVSNSFLWAFGVHYCKNYSFSAFRLLQGVQRIYGRFYKYKAFNKKRKQPSTKISYILKSGLSRDANSKEKTNF